MTGGVAAPTRAVILAAGEGRRLLPRTADRPKCLVPFAGRPLLDWQLDALDAAGVRDVALVTGAHHDALAPWRLRSWHNAHFAVTNMVASLFCARELFDGASDLLICYADIIYEPRVVETLLHAPGSLALAINTQWRSLWSARMSDPLADAETLRLDGAGHIIELGRRPRSLDEIEGQYMGLIRVRAALAPALLAAHDALDPAGSYEGRTRDTMFMTAFLQHVIDHVSPAVAARCAGGWLEIDTLSDLETFETLHRSGRLGRHCDLAAIPPRAR